MNIYWDYQNQQFVSGLTSPQVVTTLQMVLRDLQSVNLYVVRPVASSTAYYELVDPPAGWLPAFGAKLVLDGSELLVTTGWVRSATGTFSGNIDLESATLITAMTALDTLNLVGEFTLFNGAARNQSSSQFTLTVMKDVYRADDTDLGSTVPAPNFRVSAGNIYFYEPLSELWYPLTIKNVSGTIMFAPGAGVTL